MPLSAGNRLTVVIATYNRLRYLRGALESVLRQDLDRFEVHVYDDGSTDGTVEWLSGLSDDRVQVYFQPANVGWLANCNAALGTVDTEYVAMLGDDDIMAAGALRRAMEVLDGKPNVGLVHSAINLIDDYGAVIDRGISWMLTPVEDVVERGQLFIARSIRAGCRVCAATVVFRTSLLPPVPFDPADGPTADVGLWLRIALHHDVAFLGTPGADYRVHAASDSAVWSTTTPGYYVETVDLIHRLRSMKLRFIAIHRNHLHQPQRLRLSAHISGRASAALLRTAGPGGIMWLRTRRPEFRSGRDSLASFGVGKPRGRKE